MRKFVHYQCGDPNVFDRVFNLHHRTRSLPTNWRYSAICATRTFATVATFAFYTRRGSVTNYLPLLTISYIRYSFFCSCVFFYFHRLFTLTATRMTPTLELNLCYTYLVKNGFRFPPSLVNLLNYGSTSSTLSWFPCSLNLCKSEAQRQVFFCLP